MAIKKCSYTYYNIYRFAANKVCLRDVSQRFGVCPATTFRQNDRVMNFLLNIAPGIIKFGDKEITSNEFLEVCNDFSSLIICICVRMGVHVCDTVESDIQLLFTDFRFPKCTGVHRWHLY